jgi:sterol desaturase/sphingolipid hydroxylase (fatty acid hydroxylase superfamily)
MEQYGKILLIAMPMFLGLVLLERWYGQWRGKQTVRTMDMLSSLSSGVTNVVKDVLGLSITILSYGWMVQHWALTHIESSFLVYAIAFIALDFSGYWVHRLSHEINFFWNKHAIHHSSEDFNLACALRQSISSFVSLFTIFLLPAALLGVPAPVIAVIAPLHLFAQFWYHTQHIGRMGFLEHIIVTPAHHRVHHALNREYMDKNHGQIFIIWDKLFGTFQDELPGVPPIYGITRPANTWNPIKINFQHIWLLIKDAWRARSIWDKIRIWWMPTGWRPADVEARFPVQKIENPHDFERYEPKSNPALRLWASIQFSFVVLLLFYFFGNIARIGVGNLVLYAAFIYLSIYSFTELMDRNPLALGWETLKNGLGLYWIWQAGGDWFGMSALFAWAPMAIAAYFVLSTAVTAFFVGTEIWNDRSAGNMRWSL